MGRTETKREIRYYILSTRRYLGLSREEIESVQYPEYKKILRLILTREECSSGK